MRSLECVELESDEEWMLKLGGTLICRWMVVKDGNLQALIRRAESLNSSGMEKVNSEENRWAEEIGENGSHVCE